MKWPRYLPDGYTLALLATVILARLLPARGAAATWFDDATTLAIGLLFFMHGAKLSRAAILAGVGHWRLHALVLASTFVMFPLLGVLLRPVLTPLVGPALYEGVLYLCVLPATVQSAIAFTSIARGNVAAAICSASASSLAGVFVSPLLVGVMIAAPGAAGSPLAAIGRILLQLMAPFLAGHLLRPWLAPFLHRHAGVVKRVDQGSILLVVYTAFSAAAVSGLWREVSVVTLVGLLAVCAIILAVAIAFTTLCARGLGFSREDEITIVFCGSKKSMASGIPMARVLFAGHLVGGMVLPLMLFHQLQLMVCAVLAQRYARRG
jgi:solute carrier family 10 (sodium/bile acid cotransporter), member 7